MAVVVVVVVVVVAAAASFNPYFLDQISVFF